MSAPASGYISRNLAKSRSKDITGRAQKGHFGKLRHEIFSKDMGKTLLQQPSQKRSFPRFDLAHANQADAPMQGARNTSEFEGRFRSARGLSTRSSSDFDRRTKARQSKVLKALAQNSQVDQFAIDCVLNLPDLVGISAKSRRAQGTSMYASREVTPAGFNHSRQESEDLSGLPSTPSPAENVRGLGGLTYSTLQQPLTQHLPDMSDSFYPVMPTKSAPWLHDGGLQRSPESYTAGMEGTAYVRLPADLMDHNSMLSEFGSSDVEHDQLVAYEATEPPVSSQYLGRFFSYNGSPPRTPRKGPQTPKSPAASNVILEFSSPVHSQFYLTESTPVSPYVLKGQTAARTAQSPLVSSPSSVMPTPSSCESPRAFNNLYGDYIPLGAFLEDPDPWNAIGLFLGLPALTRENDQTSSAPSYSRHGSVTSSRAGVGWEAEEQAATDIEIDTPNSSFSTSGPVIETGLDLTENTSCTSESPLMFAPRELSPLYPSDGSGERQSGSPVARIDHEESPQPTREVSLTRSPRVSLVTPCQTQTSSVPSPNLGAVDDLQGPSLFSDGPGSEGSDDEVFVH
ncbi:hypothetical protein EVG20_g6317 [Dentipellis fragilis]|uniref:Uncharacterized protein n=1 Tax=Dentipellis fragilis TaxID=205917 RepID=A0A4Y9YLI6_9AGAM|nr:hypothetical protein EVG20_g6317 [Dentipellis fragilis]